MKLPQAFQDKIKIDKSLKELSEISEAPKSSSDQWNNFTRLWKEGRVRQKAIRQQCEQYAGKSNKGKI